MFLSNFLNSASDIVPSFKPSFALANCSFCFSNLSLVLFKISFSWPCFFFQSSKFELSYLRFALIALRSLCCSFRSLLIPFISFSKSLPSKLSFMLIPLTVSAINTHLLIYNKNRSISFWVALLDSGSFDIVFNSKFINST